MITFESSRFLNSRCLVPLDVNPAPIIYKSVAMGFSRATLESRLLCYSIERLACRIDGYPMCVFNIRDGAEKPV